MNQEVDQVICWLTGYEPVKLQQQLTLGVDYETFFQEAPQLNPNAAQITGSVCGIKVQEIRDPLLQKIRWLDKLIDELAQGSPLEKIFGS
ncbi:MAG: DUF2200 family protein [Oscillospiraceae bacterium]|nr:DUF2200 family protein [Oscillospiraceae bacterium]MDD4368735.1 DUF2200 family protein [Oscillospiraceae bacterium]